MGELATTVLTDGINILRPARQRKKAAGGQSNFLLPNGTFFAVLIIFLITLGVIWKWVVPPVSKVLAEREAMLAKTAADSRKSAEQVAAAQADYDQAMAGARTEASAIRDEPGQPVVRWWTPSGPRPAVRSLRPSARPMSGCPNRVRPLKVSSPPRSTDCRPPWPAASSAST